MKLTGAQILIESLLKEQVEVIFGLPGGAIIDVYDRLYDSPIRHILVRHEQGAVHMADGYARATGKVGVAMVTSGPGATNTVTGIATAYMDSIPIVVISGQVPTKLIGNDAFQEADVVGITRPCTKHNYLVKDVKDLARIVKEAFYIAKSGRPGPVLIDLPKDIQQAKTEFQYPENLNLPGYKPTYYANIKQIKKAAQLLAKAKKPVIYAGGGVIYSDGASEELQKLAKTYFMPVTNTLMGLGSFPGEDPLWLGMLGMHGTYRANMAISTCDVILAVGARFDDRVTGKLEEFAPEAKIIHIDIDPASISKNVSVDIPIVGDCYDALKKLSKALSQIDQDIDWQNKHQDWLEQINTWKERDALAYEQSPDGPIKPQFVIEKLYEITKGEAIVATEVGQNQMWAAQYFKFNRPRTLLTSGGLGTMGYGFPAAIGAQVAFPDKLVLDIAGDGSIQMNIQELATAVGNRLPVKVAILNNGYLGMVRQWQQLFYKRRYAQTSLEHSPDFVKLAEAYGAVGLRATKPQEVEEVIKKALNTNATVFMDFIIEPEENVYPMVPAGAPITKMLLGGTVLV
ncbi:MAG: Acetolactate synthase isozyme 3 large subunit [Candidatus Methanoperedenaceae archaeon GB50]|nr:Acetolactate synthase isozyme 3 large subunit [Candidatus Methanoperedenaceae archaeon GB50]CAD7771717.1 Acetolactate synthase isozyme 3 large subunit [Candidatus Methanoperedenaceae archaeon GB37]CAD7783151.1 MAG: Acetolactate synthase isozyme 3 large subunit [Candidatus Methanoperedenaceae archaeon GB50]